MQPSRQKALADRFEWHYTPKQNMAEAELSVYAGGTHRMQGRT